MLNRKIVYSLRRQGYSNTDIAKRLGVRLSTVEKVFAAAQAKAVAARAASRAAARAEDLVAATPATAPQFDGVGPLAEEFNDSQLVEMLLIEKFNQLPVNAKIKALRFTMSV